MGTEAKRTEIMEVDLDSLWDVITDYEGYADFVDGLSSTKIIERKGNDVFVEYHINMMMKNFKYILKHSEKPKKGLEWEMVEGDFFKYNNGSWELKEKGKGKIEATYSVDIGFPLLVPKSIVNGLVGSSLPSMLKKFEKRAQERVSKGAKKKVKNKAIK